MDGEIRLFSGIVDRSEPNKRKDLLAGFCSYILVKKNGKQKTIVCGSNVRYKSGSHVFGVYCREVTDDLDNKPIGILISDETYYMLKNSGDHGMNILEYGAYQYNTVSYHTSRTVANGEEPITYLSEDDLRRASEFRNHLASSGKTRILTYARIVHSEYENHPYCYSLKVENCHSDFSFCFKYTFPMDLFMPVNEEVAVILFLDKKMGAFVFPSMLTKALRAMDASSYQTMENLLLSDEFVSIGRALYKTSANGRSLSSLNGKCVKAMVLDRANVKREGLFIPIFFLSHNLGIFNYLSVKWEIAIGSIIRVRINKSKVYNDYVYSGELEISGDKELSITDGGVIESDNETVQATRVTEQNEQENEECLFEDSEHEIEETLSLMVVREGEFRLLLNGTQNRFDAVKFSSAVQLNQIGPLHYDVLEWIGKFTYVTAHLLFRLFIAGIIPHPTTHLNHVSEETVQSIVSNQVAKKTKGKNKF